MIREHSTEDARPDTAASASLWQRVSHDLVRRCRDGSFAAGIPGENDLAAEYGVSRHTIREALRPLRADGTVLSQRGRGSTVLRPTTAVEVVVSDGTDAESALLLGLAPDAALMRIRRIHRAGERVVAVETTWLPPRAQERSRIA
jgi:GntR family transcriptional regulator